MGRNRTPSKILELRGAFNKHPDRRRGGEPKPKADIGPAPAHLNEAQAALWDEMVGIALPGVLGDADRWMLEIAVCLMADYRQQPETFTAARVTQLISCLSRLGMTPADRSKVSALPQGSRDEFDDL